MAWSMPTTGQWNPGIGMTDMSSMGSYTPEQWALMQQQNWQQWSQWQQQYAQWQNQYGGEVYAQQMQSMQALSGVPPVSVSAVPPPGPPPDKPPPPPPHENDKPLYGSTGANAGPTTSAGKPQQNTQPGYNNGNTTTGNNKNWSHTATDQHSEKSSNQGVNTEALRMLAEEEKLFDIQFQKWEEEIEKWKKENVNHPDRQAYNEYEQKFEACRAQLLERRRQMKIKRDNLMGSAQSVSNTTTTGNKPNTTPTPLNTNVNNHTPNMQTNVQSNVQNQKTNVQNYPKKNPSQYQQYTKPTQSYSRNENNKTIDPQDRYDSYRDLDTDYRSAPSGNTSIISAPINNAAPVNVPAFNAQPVNTSPVNSSFLPTTKSSKDIPGLDLVPEVDKFKKHDVIDITEDISTQQENSGAPDYSKISKGINNILGDEKIMNILSMVSNQKQPPAANTNAPNQGGPYQHSGNMMQSNQWNANNSDYYNNDYNNQQPNTPSRQPNMNNYQNPQGHGPNTAFPDPAFQRHDGNYDDNARNRHGDVQQGQHNRQNQFGNQNIPHNMSQNMPPNMPPRGAPPPFRSNIPPPRPLLQNYPPQQHPNDYPQGGFEKREQQKPIMPPKPKWVDEPMFTPSIIVEYEHKPLRLKGNYRDDYDDYIIG